MTFNGCWTCKARKVRCDEQTPGCGNCAKREIECGGYDIKLQWMTDSFAESAAPIGPNNGGRRRIRLDQSIGHRYSLEEIDKFLLMIDKKAQGRVSSRKGPFSIFSVEIGSHKHGESSALHPQDGPTSTIESDESLTTLMSNHYDTQAYISYEDTPRAEQGNSILLALALSSPGIANEPPNNITTAESTTNNSCSNSLLDEELSFGENEIVTDLNDSDFGSTRPATYCGCGTSNNPTTTMQAAQPSFDLASSPIEHIQTSLFGDIEVDILMHHYTLHLANVLQPIQHPKNPYRGLYVPTALEGALIHVSNPNAPNAKPHSALHHALLASAAFHLWNCNESNVKYHKMGAQHKWHALSSLKAAFNSPTSAADYKGLLMATLCLITIGVVAGEDDDFFVHLRGAIQIRNSRRKWKVVSGSTRQLNDISAFLALLSRTVSFEPTPSPWIPIGEGAEHALGTMRPSGIGYEYMYGITQSTAAAMQETCRLAELLARYENSQGPQSIPAHVLESCESLGDSLLSWNLESENLATIPPGDDLTIFNLHARAWHCAALIYYYRRVQRYNSADLVQEIEHVAELMLAVEDIKARSQCKTTKMMAPITWPMFIASCDAVSSNRNLCRKWWEMMRHYGIANIGRQWDAVQKIWKRMDEMEELDLEAKDWTELYCDLGLNLLPV